MLTVNRLRVLLTYDTETGVFRWRERVGKKVRVGDVAGSVDHEEYILIGIDYRRYKAHRLAWLYVHGQWPVGQLDHINGNPQDNRISNLREATSRLNQENKRRGSKTSNTGVLGVSRQSGSKTFTAQITVAGKQIYLGSFATTKDAHEAYVRAKRKYHEGNTL